MRMQEPRLSLSASEWWWEASQFIEIKRPDHFFYVVAKLVPRVSFGDDALGQTFRKKPTVGFLSDFENEFKHRRKLKCGLYNC